LAHNALHIARVAEPQIDVLQARFETPVRCGVAGQPLDSVCPAPLLPYFVFYDAMRPVTVCLFSITVLARLHFFTRQHPATRILHVLGIPVIRKGLLVQIDPASAA
jgi:hypothetical protein